MNPSVKRSQYIVLRQLDPCEWSDRDCRFYNRGTICQFWAFQSNIIISMLLACNPLLDKRWKCLGKLSSTLSMSGGKRECVRQALKQRLGNYYNIGFSRRQPRN